MYLSLATIIAGVGFLKANVSTLVGSLYGAADRRRDSGFTIFYMGINLGGFLAPLLCGYLGIVYGWKYGFGLAGIGMAAGPRDISGGPALARGSRASRRIRQGSKNASGCSSTAKCFAMRAG